MTSFTFSLILIVLTKYWREKMTTSITYRPIQSGDIDQLAKIIQDTWYEGEWDHKKTPLLLSKGYLYRCLARHDFSLVALKDKKPVGVILGTGKSSPFAHKRYSLKAGSLLFKLLLYKEGREGIQELRHEHAIDTFLLEDTGESFDSELILFIMGKEARGLGIGSNLFNEFLSYQSRIKARSYFLFTDDACTVSFYDRKGLECIGSYDDNGFRYYIYKGKQPEN